MVTRLTNSKICKCNSSKKYFIDLGGGGQQNLSTMLVNCWKEWIKSLFWGMEIAFIDINFKIYLIIILQILTISFNRNKVFVIMSIWVNVEKPHIFCKTCHINETTQFPVCCVWKCNNSVKIWIALSLYLKIET